MARLTKNLLLICAAPTCKIGQSKMETQPVPTIEQPVPLYLIDVIARQVIEVPYDGSLKRLYELIDCHCIDFTARQPNGDGLYCNDLLPDEPQQAAFRLRSSGQIIYGNGVWTGGDNEGNTVSPYASFSDISADIEFLGVIPYKRSPIYIISW